MNKLLKIKNNIKLDILLKYGFVYNNEKNYYFKNIDQYHSYYKIEIADDRIINIYKLNNFDTEGNSWYMLDCEELLSVFYKLIKDQIIEIQY